MAQPVIQHSFHAGEWAPALNARTDLAKYRSAAELMRNFFVDYRGGASTRMGTKYILQAYKSATAVRLIPFQASFTVNYVLEFGDNYIRFYNNGAPVLETAKTVFGVTQASPGVIDATTGNDSFTKVLLHCDGTDASTTFTDSNAGGATHTWTANGNAQIDTADSKFGGASGLFDGTGDYVSTPDHANFTLGSSDWTVDFWFKCTATGGSFERLAGQMDGADTATLSSWNCLRLDTNVMFFSVFVGGTQFSLVGTTQFTNTLNTGWHHLAAVRTGNTLKLFIDGVQEATTAITGTINDSAQNLVVGGYGAIPGDWLGWIDEFRLSVGIARWTASFTPQTAAYSSAGHGFNTDDWVFITGVGGMTQLNGRYFRVVKIDNEHFSLKRLLDSSAVNTGAYGAYTVGGTVARVYTLPSPYSASDLALVKFAQNINTMVLCHPNYGPQLLTLVSANNWTITGIVFGATISTPTGVGAVTTLAAGTTHYSYRVTAVDFNGQESGPSAAATLANLQDITTVAGTNTVSWTGVSGAQYYNVYKAIRGFGAAVPSGAMHGFIGFTSGTSFQDTNVVSDFSITPPIPQNPFVGGPVTGTTITNPGTYTTVPTVTIAAPPAGQTATAQAVLQVQGTPTVVDGKLGHAVGERLQYIGPGGGPTPIIVVIASVTGLGGVLTVQPVTYPGSVPGGISSGSVPTNPMTFRNIDFSGVPDPTLNCTWGVGYLNLISGGTGYISAPAVTFSAGAATATASIGGNTGNPSVPAFFQQRLVLAGPPLSPGQMNLSRPASFFNFDKSNPIQADDAIQETLSSLSLQSIKSMVPMPSGLVTFTDKQAWLVNGGVSEAPITPIEASAHPQSYNGASDLPPIVGNNNILYVQAKGSIVRDLAFNFYTQIYTGTDISVLSSHLFYGHTIVSWAFAEEPFKVIWAIRSDGKCLSLTFLKEQDLIGWAQHDTNGLFKSNCVIPETVPSGTVDATYFVVQRTINGNTVQYIERTAERVFPNGVADAWCVDSGLQYSGSPATSFFGAEHLANTVLTGLADGQVVSVTPSIDGTFTLAQAASKVTVGLSFLPQLKTVRLDLGEPTVQGKRKSILGTTARVHESLGLSVGKSFTTLVPMKDLVRNNVGTMSNALVTDLVTGDARTITDPVWDTFGQLCFQQNNPFPATVLGIMPEVEVGDTRK